ncbi:MAG: hypothetical protein J5552_00710 [Prevotella sp.]|nr:hypothetical protein [Prevotella sp.]
MKRRCIQHDYRERGIYMLTMAIEGRRPLLGRLAGDAEKAFVELTALGERVKQCWLDIPRHYPSIEVMRLCIMPDHIHGVLFVHEQLEKHLGQVVSGFKAGCNKAARELGVLLTAAMPPFTKPGKVRCDAALPQRAGCYDRKHGVLWEPGYHDRILRGKNQLARMLAYVEDNPRRLLLKRLHPEFFTRLGTLDVRGIPMEAMGNRFLLDNPIKMQVQCSRHLYPSEIDAKQTLLASAHDQGAILVSPCISPGEQQIATAALDEGIPLIVLLLNGFPAHFKPQPRYFEACLEGRLLMLAPFAYQTEKLENMRQRCLQLNDLAARLCE